MNPDASDQATTKVTPTHGVWMVVGAAALALIALGVIFRSPGKE